ncbi:hypothetical protein HMPREF1545_02895 [Oscillibacter sp. KLE 1728]|nr:hypothetical protein HMPREF1545_02895 [Oscillibacter sp. KLE 1728]ERK62382.1 hypothetical protein HMPREF1546_02769 [Oscillibacter sp. KLE 1745]
MPPCRPLRSCFPLFILTAPLPAVKRILPCFPEDVANPSLQRLENPV